MERTEFLSKAFNHFIDHDLNDMKYFFKDPYYFEKIEDGFTKDTSNKVADKMNLFFKEHNINKNLGEIEALYFCQPRLKETYSGIGIVVDFNDLYEELIEEGLLAKPDKPSVMYRIENKSGVGFYSHFQEKGNSLAKHIEMDVSNTPSPMSDGLLALIYHNPLKISERDNYSFGFKDKEEAAKWLTEEERIIEYIINDDDLFFSEYEIDPVYSIHGNKQMICLSDKMKLKNRIPLQEAMKGQKELLEYKEKLQHNTFSEEEKNEIISFLKNKDGSVEIKKTKKRKNKRREQNNNDKQMPLF